MQAIRMGQFYRTGLMFSMRPMAVSTKRTRRSLHVTQRNNRYGRGPMPRPHPEAISPPAHYTGYVWFVHGQSHEAFATRKGRLMYHALRGPNAVAHAAKLPTLEGMLLARHQ